MTITPFQALTCPLDGAPLSAEERRWCCPSGHSFDTARHGYVHLLPVQNKRSRDPGDSKDMVAARQRFLAHDDYHPIAEAVSRRVLAAAPSTAPLRCLDAGCGEGYYLRMLAESATAAGRDLELLGLDISKWAVQAAARQDRRVRWLVASNANLPVADNALDWVLCLFGFPVYDQFARVLKPGGRLLQVDAGPEHLRQLREILYPQLRESANTGADAPAGFEREDEERIHYPLTLPSQERIADLLAMTPHGYRAKAEGLARAAALDALEVTVDVRLVSWQRR